MKKADIRTAPDAILYMAECQLATVSHMQAIKSKSKYQYERHIGIAQHHVDFILRFCKGLKKTGRVKNVVANYSGNVKDWVNELDTF